MAATVSAGDVGGAITLDEAVEGRGVTAAVVDAARGRLMGERCSVVAPDLKVAASLAALEFALPALLQDASTYPQITKNIAVTGLGAVLNHFTMTDCGTRM